MWWCRKCWSWWHYYWYRKTLNWSVCRHRKICSDKKSKFSTKEYQVTLMCIEICKMCFLCKIIYDNVSVAHTNTHILPIIPCPLHKLLNMWYLSGLVYSLQIYTWTVSFEVCVRVHVDFQPCSTCVQQQVLVLLVVSVAWVLFSVRVK